MVVCLIEYCALSELGNISQVAYRKVEEFGSGESIGMFPVSWNLQFLHLSQSHQRKFVVVSDFLRSLRGRGVRWLRLAFLAVEVR